jgi:hypothetical protein
MSPPSIARYLRDFGAAAEPSVGRPGASRAAEIDAAFARGVEHGQAAARASLEAKLASQQRQFDLQLAAEREARALEAGKLAAALAAGLASLEQRIADSVGRLLRPFLAARVHAEALAELRAALTTLLQKEPGIALRIAGPEQLLAPLRANMPQGAISYVANGDCEVRVSANDTVLETRLGAWLKGLEGPAA